MQKNNPHTDKSRDKALAWKAAQLLSAGEELAHLLAAIHYGEDDPLNPEVTAVADVALKKWREAVENATAYK